MKNYFLKILLLVAIITLIGNPFFAFADLQSNIDATNAQIQALQAQVTAYQNQVDVIDNQAQTLQSNLNSISKSQQSLKTNLTLTGKKINVTTLTITQNQNQIGNLGQGIASDTSALSETIRSLYQDDQQTILGLLLSQDSVSSFLRDVDDVQQFQLQLKNQVVTMQTAKTSLQQAQVSLAQKKSELENLKGTLSDQKQVIDAEANQKTDLLAQTRGEESAYQKLLDATKAQVAQLEKDQFNYESQLNFTLNQTELPAEGSAPLAWPLADVLITQRFGKTVDSKRLYVSGSHSGVDFRAAVGTPVYAVADGTVKWVGNTDLTCPRASFGKWVFIVHNDGLATAYGHLSVIKATAGETVKTGDLIGYSGQTGHVTGPHLHVTVFAANGINGEEGARVGSFPSAVCYGKAYTMPIAPTSAYLDPLEYLPHATANMFKDGIGEDSGE